MYRVENSTIETDRWSKRHHTPKSHAEAAAIRASEAMTGMLRELGLADEQASMAASRRAERVG